MANSVQLAGIGAGPGGYVAAFKAADLGRSVALIDKDASLGGVCLIRGCIPSKALLHVAKLLNETRDAGEWGLTYAEPEIDLARLNAWKDGVVSTMTGGLRQLARARKITCVEGTATFVNAHTLRVSAANDASHRAPISTLVANSSANMVDNALPSNAVIASSAVAGNEAAVPGSS